MIFCVNIEIFKKRFLFLFLTTSRYRSSEDSLYQKLMILIWICLSFYKHRKGPDFWLRYTMHCKEHYELVSQVIHRPKNLQLAAEWRCIEILRRLQNWYWTAHLIERIKYDDDDDDNDDDDDHLAKWRKNVPISLERVPVSWNKVSPLQTSSPSEIESPAGGFWDVKKLAPRIRSLPRPRNESAPMWIIASPRQSSQA